MNPASVGRFIDRLEGAFRADDARSANKEVEAANVRRLQEQYRAILRGDFAFVSDSMADDIDMEMIGPPNLPLVGHWHGRQEVAEAVRNNFAQLENQDPEVLAVVAQGDIVVLFARETGVYRPTGKRYAIHWVQLFTFANGKISRFRGIYDTASMLDAMQ
jgi:uncharacterized protein